MLKDPDTSDVHTITLSYSMFKAANQQTDRQKTVKLGPNS
jgi:cytochrome c oxidase assembly protein Cox11